MEDLSNLRKIAEKIDELIIEAERVNDFGKKINLNLVNSQSQLENFLIDQKNITDLNTKMQIQILKNKDEINNTSEKLKLDVKKIINSIDLNFHAYEKKINILKDSKITIDRGSLEIDMIEILDKFLKENDDTRDSLIQNLTTLVNELALIENKINSKTQKENKSIFIFSTIQIITIVIILLIHFAK